MKDRAAVQDEVTRLREVAIQHEMEHTRELTEARAMLDEAMKDRAEVKERLLSILSALNETEHTNTTTVVEHIEGLRHEARRSADVHALCIERSKELEDARAMLDEATALAQHPKVDLWLRNRRGKTLRDNGQAAAVIAVLDALLARAGKDGA